VIARLCDRGSESSIIFIIQAISVAMKPIHACHHMERMSDNTNVRLRPLQPGGLLSLVMTVSHHLETLLGVPAHQIPPDSFTTSSSSS
jgi:hypothetical protein